MANKSNRRQFLQTTAAATVLSTARGAPAHSKSNSIYLDKLGLQPVINGVGTVTVLGGSIMPPEVVQAMVEASKHFIQLPGAAEEGRGDVSQSCSRFRATMVSCGAASAITVATAACVVSGDPAKAPTAARHRPG